MEVRKLFIFLVRRALHEVGMSTTKVTGIVSAEISLKLHEVPLHVVNSRSVFDPRFVKKE